MRHRYELRMGGLVLQYDRARDAMLALRVARRTRIGLQLYRDGASYEPAKSVLGRQPLVVALQLTGKLARAVEAYALAHQLDTQTAVLRLLKGHPILGGKPSNAP